MDLSKPLFSNAARIIVASRALQRAGYVFVITTALSGFLAFAHAILMKSTPLPNGIVSGPDVPVVLSFNSKVDQGRSSLTIEKPDHSTSKVAIVPDPSSPARLVAKLSGMAAGPYKLRWQVLAADGHITRGEIPFRIR
jgi:methionine-rich copper-binding protein CopC